MSLRLGYDLSEPQAQSDPQAKFVDDVASHLEFDALRRSAGAVHPAVFLDRLLNDAVLEEQSRIIAAKLEAAGWNPYTKRNADVVLIGTVTGAILRGHNYRNINILPVVAKRNRAELISEFKLFLKESPRMRRYVRYAVATSGERFKVEELPERYKEFSGSIGRFLEEAKRRGQDVYLCTIEMTFDADATVNLHANIVYRPRCVVGSTQWKEWLRDCRKHFGESFFRDAGKLRSPNSVIRYVCKPMELLALSNEQTRFVAETVHGKQIVRPVGQFASWRRALRVSGCKVIEKRPSGDVIRLMRAQRPAGASGLPESQNNDERKEERFCTGRSLDHDITQPETSLPISPEENRILRITRPMARASLIAEPFAVVRNYTSTPSTQRGLLGLKKLERKRLQYIRVLAEKNIGLEAIQTASSILDLFTVIPNRVAEQFGELARSLRARLQQRLALESEDSNQDKLKICILRKLRQLVPRERHPWDANVADLEDLYLVARAQTAMMVCQNQVNLTEDDLIPY